MPAAAPSSQAPAHPPRTGAGQAMFARWLLPWLALLCAAARPAVAQEPAAAAAVVPTAPVSQQLAIVLDPAPRQLAGRATITVRGAQGFEILLDARFTVDAASLDGSPLPAPRRSGAYLVWRVAPGAAQRTLAFAWRGTLAALVPGQAHRDTLSARQPVADAQGSFLPAGSAWYPLVLRAGDVLLHDFALTLDLPHGQRGLVAGRLRDEVTRDGRSTARFEFPHPAEGIDLMAGPYRVSERSVQSRTGRPILLRTWFHPELEALAPAYLDAVRDYLALYEEWIGPYPFDSFSVVSSPTPTGFGMPSLTYLGREVLQLPFIRATALGHEVLHNWWGNGVYPDYARGNWSEGLTTFMADYAYAERESPDKARAMRLGWLRDLSAIPPGADRPLAAFTARHHGVAQAVGYNKAALLFVMLRARIGAEAFDHGVRRFWHDHRFRSAGWDALRGAFEAASGEDLRPFFAQWVERPGLPQLALDHAEYRAGTLSVTLSQTSPPYLLDVPLRIEHAGGSETRVVRLDRARQRFEFPLATPPARVTLDPDSQLARRLAPAEAPPILRELQLDTTSALLVLGDDPAFSAAAQALAARLLDHAPAPHPAAAAPGARPLLVIAPSVALDAWRARHHLPPAPPEVAGQGDARMWTLRLPSGAPLALIAADSATALAAATRPLPHYRQQSWLVLEGGRAQGRGVWPARAPFLDVRGAPGGG